jgi:general stress protein 26
MPEDELQKVYHLLKSFDTAMLVTHTGGAARGRPMAIARVEPDGDLWFFTGRDTSKTHEIEANPDVLIVCQNDHTRYLSVSGTASIVADRARAAELWRETYRPWFPQGVDDPNLVLISVRIREAEFWDNQGVQAIRYLMEAAKAYATATRPQVREGEQHGKVSVRH